MGALLLATEGGRVKTGPGRRTRFYPEGTQVPWEWPLLDKDDENFDGDKAPPSKWRILNRNLDDDTMKAKLQQAEDAVPDDPHKGRDAGKELDVGRGYSEQDQTDIKQAIDSLDNDEKGHWTSRGKPQVDAVQTIVEQIQADDDRAEGGWPDWVDRKAIDAASSRVRE